MPKRTILVIPRAHRRYAEAHGAVYDPVEGVWYIEGEVPAELSDYVVNAPRSRDFTREIVPSCPVCNSRMTLRAGKKTGDFWGCTKFPRCKGTRSIDYDPVSPVWKDPAKTAIPKPQPALSDDVICQVGRVVDLLERCIPDRKRAEDWLKCKRVSFGNHTAIELMKTVRGCAQVEKLLRDSFDIPD